MRPHTNPGQKLACTSNIRTSAQDAASCQINNRHAGRLPLRGGSPSETYNGAFYLVGGGGLEGRLACKLSVRRINLQRRKRERLVLSDYIRSDRGPAAGHMMGASDRNNELPAPFNLLQQNYGYQTVY